MAYTLYPQPPTSPLVVNPSSETGLMPVHLPAIPNAPFYDVFIRLTMSGPMVGAMDPLNPTLSLKAGASANPPTALSVNSNVVAINDGAMPVANAAMQWEGNNTYLVTISIFGTTAGWSLTLKNNDPAAARNFVWIAANVQAELQQPWLDVTPTLSYTALPNQVLSQMLIVSNYGTQPFTINSLNPSLGAVFTLSPGLPLTVGANSAKAITVNFTAPSVPASNTIQTTVVTTPSDPQATTLPGHNQQVTVTTLVQLPANIEAANRLRSNQNALIRGAFGFLATQYPSIQLLLNTNRRGTAACLRDLRILLPPIIQACEQGSTTVLDQPLQDIRNIYVALGFPGNAIKDFYQYIRNHHGLTGAVATAANIYLDYAIAITA